MSTKPGRVTTKTVMLYDVFNIVFEKIGGIDEFAEWAREERTEFYKLMTKVGTNAALIDLITARQSERPADETPAMSSQRFLDIAKRAHKLAEKHTIENVTFKPS